LKTKSSHLKKRAIQQIDLLEQRRDLLLYPGHDKHRDYFTNNMTRIYAETGKEMKAALKEQEYQNRVLTITLCYWLL
jgi:hypothetical protein